MKLRTLALGILTAAVLGCTSSPVGQIPQETQRALNISLAADTPLSSSLVVDPVNGGQAGAKVLSLKFSTKGGGILLKGMRFRRIGISNDADINNAYLDIEGTKGEPLVGSNGGKSTFPVQSISNGVLNFGNFTFMMGIGTAATVSVRIDLSKTAKSGTTVGLQLENADSIDGKTAWKTDVTGGFPLSGNLMQIATVGDLGVASISPFPSSGKFVGTTPMTGDCLGTFSIYAKNQNLKLTKLTLTNMGGATKLQNLRLYAYGNAYSTQLGTTVANVDENNQVSFNFSDTPLFIANRYSMVVTLFADTTSLTKGDTVQFSVQNAADVSVIDQQYNIPLFPFSAGGTVGVWTAVDSDLIKY